MGGVDAVAALTPGNMTTHARRKQVPPARRVPLLPWRLREVSRNVHVLTFDHIRAGWEQHVLLQSDEHWDNPHCDRALYRKHLDEAMELRAPVLKYGDLFCAMQGKFDKRASKSDIRPEHNHGNYLDRLVETAAEWHRPYASIMCVAGPGNHETAILKRHETHLTAKFVERLRVLEPKSPICMGGFSGWVRFQFNAHIVRQRSLRLWYHHGYGGGGPVTRGVIQSNRRAVYMANADIIATGHTHDSWIVPIERIELTKRNAIRRTRQYHVSSPGYKDEYADGHGGWHIERGGPPKPLGAVWLRFWYYDAEIHVEARLAE